MVELPIILVMRSLFYITTLLFFTYLLIFWYCKLRMETLSRHFLSKTMSCVNCQCHSVSVCDPWMCSFCVLIIFQQLCFIPGPRRLRLIRWTYACYPGPWFAWRFVHCWPGLWPLPREVVVCRGAVKLVSKYWWISMILRTKYKQKLCYLCV